MCRILKCALARRATASNPVAQLLRRPVAHHQHQLQPGPRHADEQLAKHQFVELVEIDLGKNHRRRRLALEAVHRFGQQAAVAEDLVAEQVVFARERFQGVRVAQRVELEDGGFFAAAKRGDGDVLAPVAGGQAGRDGVLGLRQHGVRVALRIDQVIDVGAVEGAGRLHRLARFANGRQQLDDLARAAVVGLGVQGYPARQRYAFPAVQVLRRVFQPDRAAIFLEHAQHDVAPGAGEILALVDDDNVELPALGQLGVIQHVLDLFPDAGPFVVGNDAARPLIGVAQHVEIRDQAAGRHQALDMVGQRAVVADVQGAQAGVDGGGVFGQRQLGLAAAGRAHHAQAVRRELEPARPSGQATGQARDHFFGVADHRAGVGLQAQRVAEEARNFFELVRGPGDGQQLAHLLAELVLVVGVDDVARLDAGQVRVAHDVVGTVQQIIDRQVAFEALGQRVDRARDLRAHLGRLAAKALDQAILGFAEEAGFLFDQQYASVGSDDDEIDFAVGREALFDLGPVHAVVDAVRRVAQGFVQVGQRIELARGGARDGHFGPAGRVDISHGVRRCCFDGTL